MKKKLKVSERRLREVLQDYAQYGGAKMSEILHMIAPIEACAYGGAYTARKCYAEHYDLRAFEAELRQIATESPDGLWMLNEPLRRLKARLLR